MEQDRPMTNEEQLFANALIVAKQEIDKLRPEYNKVIAKMNALKHIVRGTSYILGEEVDEEEYGWIPRRIEHGGNHGRTQRNNKRRTDSGSR